MVEVVEACIDGRLDQIDLKFKEDAAVCVVLASDGYPVSYEKGFPIRGLENFKGRDGYSCSTPAANSGSTGKSSPTAEGFLESRPWGKTLQEARKNAYGSGGLGGVR